MKSGWTSAALGDIAPSRSLQMPASSHEVWNLSLEDIEGTTGRILAKIHCPIASLGSSKCSFDGRHVLYSKLRPYLNKVVLPDEPGVGTSELLPLLPDSRRLDREFLAYYLRSPGFLDFTRTNTRGANLPRVAMSELWAHQVPFPIHLQEQRRIVSRITECMERLSEVVLLHSEQSTSQGQIVRAARREVLGSPSNLPEHWVLRRLDEVADVVYGISEAISGNRDPSLGPPIIRMANISLDGHLDLSDLRYCRVPKGRERHFALMRGDLLLNWRSGSSSHVGKTAMFDAGGLFTCASFILRIRAKSGLIDNRYLRHVLNFMRAEGVFANLSRMQINHKLNATEFSAVPVRMPPAFASQDSIAEILDAAESLASRIRILAEEKAREIGELRKAILRKAFSGEL